MRLILATMLAIPLLAATSACQEDETTGDAEKLFQKMEQTLVEAKTLQFGYRIVLNYSGRESERLIGAMVLAEGNKAKLTWTGKG